MSLLAAIPGSLGLVALWWVWRQRRDLPGPDLVARAVLAALVPAAASAAVAGWTLRAVFTGIAESGSGGVRFVAHSMQGPADALLAGLVSLAVVVAAGLVAGLGRGPAPAAHGGPPPRAVGPILAAVLGVLLTALVVRAADRIVFGSLAFMAPILAASGDVVPATPALLSLAADAAREGLGAGMASDISGHMPVATWGAAALCVLLIVAALAGARASRASERSVGWPAAWTVALAVLAAAAVYGSYVWPAVRWLGAVVAGGSPA